MIVTQKPKPVCRILMVEDDPDRTLLLQSWLPPDVRTVVVTSAGRAIGLLERDRGNVYAGILLDHDLQQQISTEADRHLSGSNVVESIIRNVSKDVPVFVHSGNLQESPLMVRRLEESGFRVTRMQIDNLTRIHLQNWMEDVRELWEDLEE